MCRHVPVDFSRLEAPLAAQARMFGKSHARRARSKGPSSARAMRTLEIWPTFANAPCQQVGDGTDPTLITARHSMCESFAKLPVNTDRRTHQPGTADLTLPLMST